MTDNINSDNSATSTTAKWKGRNKDLAPWFIPFADALEKHPTYGHFLRTRTKSLNNGKTAVDSKAAISAMLDGKHEILSACQRLSPTRYRYYLVTVSLLSSHLQYTH